MDKIEVLREKIASNKNMNDAFKKNIVTLTDTLVTVFPDYDFETYDFLSTLRIESDNNMDSYTNYNKDENLLKINIDRCFTDRIDIQHLFLTEMILISTDAYSKSEDFNGFNRGVAEEIATIINPDESMKKLNPLSSTLVAAFSKVVDSSVLLSSQIWSRFEYRHAKKKEEKKKFNNKKDNKKDKKKTKKKLDELTVKGINA